MPAAPNRRMPGRYAPGYTLMEVLLVLLLLVMMSTMLIGALYGSLDSVRIEQNTSRVTAMLRAARADATLTGRRLRVSFDDTTGEPMVGIESDPLGAPNEFVPYQGSWADRIAMTGGVRIKSCRLTGASAFRELSAEGVRAEMSETAGVLSPITFTPEGGSDSVLMVLGFEDEEDDSWTVEITLNGTDGTIETVRLDLLTEEELKEREEEFETRE